MSFDQAQYQDFLKKVEAVVGAKYCVTDPKLNRRNRKGIRYGEGDSLAVVKPGTLVEYYKVVKLACEHDVIIISQAANTGLTGGSTPFGNDYDRPNIVINTLRLDKFKIINNQEQVLCHAGATLYRLEDELKKIGREPHSVIGSSCIGASVIGGVCNNSGGALVQRGPSYTEYACYARVNQDGTFEFVNNLGINFGSDDPEVILQKLENGEYSDADIDHSVVRKASSTDYVEHVTKVDEPTPARYNADPHRLKEASGSAGHLAVFAVRLDTFKKAAKTQVFYIGANDIQVLTDVRRAALTQFSSLPISGEYIHRDAYEIGKVYGKDTTFVLDKIGTKHLPFLYSAKDFYDRTIGKLPFVPNSDQFLQFASKFLPYLLPKRMEEYAAKYEHHLILNCADDVIEEADKWLQDYFGKNGAEAQLAAQRSVLPEGQTLEAARPTDGDFFRCEGKEGAMALLHRFSIAGAAIRYRECHPKEVGICAIDVALRRNDHDWFEKLPPEIEAKITKKLYYGHFLCHVFHQDYLVLKPHDPLKVEEEILETLHARGAKYPAEHNVGHLYHAEDPLVQHYHNLDPTNHFNPGVGKTSKLKNWKGQPQFSSCGCGDHH